MIEAVLAFFLVTVVLSTAVAGRAGKPCTAGDRNDADLQYPNGWRPHGSSLQPGAALGPMVATGNFTDAWLYLTAPIVGAIVAAIVHTGLTRLDRNGMAATDLREPAQTLAE